MVVMVMVVVEGVVVLLVMVELAVFVVISVSHLTSLLMVFFFNIFVGILVKVG